MFSTKTRALSALVVNCIQDHLLMTRFPIFSRSIVSWKKKHGKHEVISPYDNKKDAHAKRYTKPDVRFLAQGVDINKYTIKAIPYPKTGGRNWWGQIENRRIGGGCKQKYRMIDFTRNAINESTPLVEKVLVVRYDPLRSANIAMVASANHKRWIIASDRMKAGDIIKSHSDIPKLPVAPKDGDAYPVGSLPIGSIVHNIEKYTTLGGYIARAAGTSGTVKGTQGDKCIVKMPSGREMCIDKHCIVTAGRASNINHNKVHVGSAQKSRWLGVRPSSGLYHRKTGYHGRKVRLTKKSMVTYEKKTKPSLDMFDP